MLNGRFTIKIKPKQKSFTILPLCDLHIDKRAFRKDNSKSVCDIRGVKIALKEVRDNEDTYFFINGDLFEDTNNTTRKRKAYQDGRMTVSTLTTEDEDDMDFIDKHIAPLFKGISDKCMGVIMGNHFKIFSNGDTNIEYLCRKAGLPLLGMHSGFLRLNIFKNKSKCRKQDFWISHHTKTGNKKGNDLNKIQESSNVPIADAYFYAHSHFLGCIMKPRPYLNKIGDAKVKYVPMIRGGGFRKSFSIDAKNCDYPEFYDGEIRPTGYIRFIVNVKIADQLKISYEPQEVYIQ